MFTYGSTNSWTLTYNLYADRLLQTNIVSESVSVMGSGSEPDAERPLQVYDRQGDYYYDLISDGTCKCASTNDAETF